MKLEDMEKLCDTAVISKRYIGDMYSNYSNPEFVEKAVKLIPKLIAVAKAAKGLLKAYDRREHERDCQDRVCNCFFSDTPPLQKALEDLEKE